MTLSDVHTYADGYGLWHALVPRSPHALSIHDRADERNAAIEVGREAIHAELDARGDRSPAYRADVALLNIKSDHYEIAERARD